MGGISDLRSIAIGSKQSSESCNYAGAQTDWDTGNVWSMWPYAQSWVQGTGGYADDWWDCTFFQSIEHLGQGSFSPGGWEPQLIPYEQFRP